MRAACFNDYRVMQAAALALAALAGLSCRRGALQDDAGGGPGTIGLNAAAPGDGATTPGDGPRGAIDVPGSSDGRFPDDDRGH